MTLGSYFIVVTFCNNKVLLFLEKKKKWKLVWYSKSYLKELLLVHGYIQYKIYQWKWNFICEKIGNVQLIEKKTKKKTLII